MSEKEGWKDEKFNKKEAWVPGQWVPLIEAPCGCRINVWADDVFPGPHLDTSHCRASTVKDQAEIARRAKAEIETLKKEVAAL